jgi:hypothetical protein
LPQILQEGASENRGEMARLVSKLQKRPGFAFKVDFMGLTYGAFRFTL